MIRITVHSSTHVTITRRPSWLAHWLLGREETVRDVHRVRILGDLFDWVYDDDYEVEPEIEEAIERMTKARERQDRQVQR